ncbi:hypothetical protein ABND25_18230 [Paenibacillus larvae]
MQIVTALNDTSVVDMSLQQYGNVHLWKYHGGSNQKWRAIYDKTKEAYQFRNLYDENLVLAWNAISNSRQRLLCINKIMVKIKIQIEKCIGSSFGDERKT